MDDSPAQVIPDDTSTGFLEPSTANAPAPKHWGAAFMPWMASVLLHAMLLTLAAFVVYAFQAAEERDSLLLTSFDNSEVDAAVQPQNPELRPVEQADLPTPEIQIDPAQTDLTRLDAEFSMPTSADLSIVGIGGEADSGLDGWRVLSGAGGGPKATFFGQRGRGGRIVYVIDRSGSMADSFDFLRRELKRSINALHHNQKFHVILFNDGYLEMPPARAVSAIGVNKRRCFEFLDGIHPGGMTDPIPAMKQAFRKEPDLIFFLTDGEFSPALVDELRKWNKRKKVKIFTLAYIYASGANLLKKIAAENGGTYTFVDGSQVP
ncbi:MAG: VWA domain-containing protein [Phycisphaerales bacterium]|nr:MAG: VWA domain-containing protein [Phycisphaerales bacterium]